MPNPWLTKNPFMSRWLSTENRMAGSVRGQATAQIKRRVNDAVTEVIRERQKLWSDGARPAPVKARRSR